MEAKMAWALKQLGFSFPRPHHDAAASSPTGAASGGDQMAGYSDIAWRLGFAWHLGAAILSGLLTALATMLEPIWWAAWLAPIPLLIVAFRSSFRATWLWVAIATLVGLTGRLGYDLMFLGAAGEAIVALLSVGVSGAIVTLTRALVLRRHPMIAIFFYPAAAAGLTTILAATSPHGTAGSIAYSQMTFLPAIQIASLAGTAGIVFTLALFAALVATAWHCRAEPPRRSWAVYGIPSLVIIATLGHGMGRLAQGEDAKTFPVGLAVADNASPARGASIDLGDKSWTDYAATIPALAKAGAKVVVWPEKIAPLDPPGIERVRKLLGYAAHAANVYLLAGVTVIGSDHLENRAWLFAPSGELSADYSKQHLVPGFEQRFKPGDENIAISILGTRFGIAICKDMDFAQLGRAYSQLGVNAMLVPGYDFDADAWSHASLSVLRGVEGGFSVIRSGRHGLLLVSDRYGRIIDRKASADASVVSLETAVPLGPGEATIYARLGYVFGWLCVAFAVLVALSLAMRRTR
jgi:apolipoprotein N-acyltransferase